MSVTLNAKGTTVPYFTIGKNGTTLYQGTADPSGSYTINNGDYWFNSTLNSLNVRVSSAWASPSLGGISFPSGGGTNGQVLATNGSGVLSWTTVVGVGTLGISDGGTGATTAATARTNLGVSTGVNASAILPSGTTAQRDGSPAAGYIRFNSTLSHFEGYNGTVWTPVATRNTWNSGDVIQEVVYTDAGATHSGTSFNNTTVSYKPITPKSTSSKILVSVTYTAGVGPQTGVNATGIFQLWEATAGFIGVTSGITAAVGAGGIGPASPSAISVIYSNTSSAVKQFSMQSYTTSSGSPVSATGMVWSLREIQN